MPIQCAVAVRPIPEEEFHEIDEQVMGLVFGVHNEIGSLCDERVYQDELAYRCRAAGFEGVLRELPIQVSFKDFRKTYLVDLLVNRSVPYELKAAKQLTGEHRKQLLNYLFLLGLSHGKLVNMRPLSVEFEFVSTQLTPERRYGFSIQDGEWIDLDKDGVWLRELMRDLLSDWGAFLETDLFYEAIEFLRGGEDNVVRRIDLVDGSRVIGSQRAHLLSGKIAFKITAVTKDPGSYEKHLRRFLSHTTLKAIQWVNLNHHVVSFKTLRR